MKYRRVEPTILRVATLCVGLLASSLALADPAPCKARSLAAGSCFTVQGRLRLYNGTPSIRIWQIGTSHLLGVADAQFSNFEDPGLPPPLGASLDWDTAYFANYTVCPMRPEQPGTMRLVCIQAIAHLRRLKL